MNKTKIIIVTDYGNDLYKNYCGIRDFLAVELGMDVICQINSAGIIKTDVLDVLFYPASYHYANGIICDYFFISTMDINEYSKWLYQLGLRGKELTTFRKLKDKIIEVIGMKKNQNIKKVIFNDPATIVLWNDGTKTVVKRGKNDTYDPEKGLAMAISKKALGNQGNYYDIFKKWLPNITATSKDDTEKTCNIGNSIKYGFSNGIKIADAIDRVSEFLNSSTTAHDDEEKNNG